MRRALPIFVFFMSWIIGLSWLNTVKAQVSVQTGSPYDQYVYGIAGSGVNISNVNINCDTVGAFGNGPQMSGFMAPGTTVNLDSGLLMTSGSVDFSLPGVPGGSGAGLNTPGDPALLPLLPAGSVTNDACIITFDIFPTCDSIKLKFVFASHEYPTFTTNYHDIFAAFISGGSYGAPTNFVFVPTTTTAVYTGTVNAAVNSAYFVAAPNGTGYTGHSVVIEAVAAVDPCQTHTIKLVIADEQDAALDSGVFIESMDCNSTSSGGSGGGSGLVVARNYNNPDSAQVVEECVDGYFTVYNVLDTTQAFPLTLTVLGTATQGTDYTIPSTSVIIPPGQDSLNIPVTVLPDGVLEGPETITLAISGIPCIGDDTATLTILDPFVVDAGPDASACSEEVIQIGGVPDTTVMYSWSGTIGMQGPVNSANPSVALNTPFTQVIDYVLTATDVNGCIDEDTVQVEFVALPIADFAMDDGVCVNEVTTITFTAPATAGGTYVWDFGPNTSSVLGTGIGPYQVSWSTTGPKIVSVLVQDGACESELIVDTIIVHPIPTASFTATASICENEQTQLTYTGTGSLTASYVWDLDGGAPAVNGPGPHTVGWSSPGPKTITLTVEENGCVSAPFSQTVMVNPLPSASFSVQPTVCEDDPIQAVYTGSSDSTASYAWTFGGGQVLSGTGQGPYQVQWLTTGQKTICLQVQENGCLSNLNCQDVTVTPRPNIDIVPVANQCFLGNSFTFTTTGGTADTYIWNFGASADTTNSSSATPGAVSYLSPGIKTVSLVTVLNGCVGDSSVISFEVVEEPSADFIPSTSAICTDSCISFTYGGSSIPPTQSFAWDFGPGAAPATSTLPTPPCVEYVTGGSKTVSLTVSYKGCTVTSTQSVQVAAVPLAAAGLDQEYCEGTGGVQLNGSVSGGTAPYFYSWWCDGSPNCGIGNVAAEDPFVNPNVNQPTEIVEYYFQITDVNGCESRIDTVLVTVKARPRMDAGPDTALCPASAPGAFLQGGLAPDNQAPGPISYFWSPPQGLNNPNDNPNPYARPDTTTIYTLIGVSANGCSSVVNTLDPESTVEVTVKPRPVAFAGPDTSMCVDDQVQLQGFASGAGPNYDYVWTPALPGTIDDPSSPTPIVTPEATTTFTLTVISNGCESDGDQIEVVVETRPTLTAGTDETICLNDSVQLDGRANGDPDAESYNYEWSPATGLSDPTSATPMASPEITTEYILRVSSEFGCESANDTILVTVEPTPEVLALSPDTVICAGEEIVLEATHSFTTPVGGPVIYEWSPADQILTDIYSPTITAAPTRTTRYIVKTSIASNDCPTYDDVLVIVNPQVEASIEADTNRICEGEPLQLRASGGQGSADFSWSPVDGLDDPTSQTPTATPNENTTYQVIVTEGVCADTSEYEVIVNAAPVADYLATLTEGCAPLTVAFMPIDNDASNYRWDFGDGTEMINTEAPTHTFTAPGQYTVSLTTSGTGGCEGVNQDITVMVTEPPTANFAADPAAGEEIPLPGASVTFTDQSEGAISWLWDFGDGGFASSQNPTHAYELPGTYNVRLSITDEQGCLSTIEYGPFTVYNPEVVIPNIFTPNADGINDQFQVRYTGTQTYSLTLQDRWGRTVFEATGPASSWDGMIGNNEASEGVYYYFLRIGEEEYTGNLTLLR